MKEIVSKYWLPVLTIILVVLIISGGFVAFQRFNEQYQIGQLRDYVYRAQQATDDGDYVTAFDLYNQARALDPSDKDIVSEQADVAFLNGDYDLSLQLYKIAGITESAEILYVDALKALTQFSFETTTEKLSESASNITETSTITKEKIEDITSQVTTIEKEENSILRRAEVGRILITVNAYNYAQQVLLDLIESEPLYHDAHYLLAVAYVNQGNFTNAVSSLEDALEIMPSYEPATTLLNQINPQQ